MAEATSRTMDTTPSVTTATPAAVPPDYRTRDEPRREVDPDWLVKPQTRNREGRTY
eukprot:CAMPEP_0185184954 /NCGR_PEP_ID=MMETSP1140-20130426/2874_1 /TAXON_ID=298111 /ORGANISM="Pavlova sp., Strain CCMP459" /LENGTH=55 /DNA_ID=CAMNT_0027751047 /DNA_START=87 /DNA_END=251 /DNA_ORIENTATION=-